MARYGYARVSTIDQDLQLQEDALRAAGCDIVRAEKVSGTMRDGRAELALLLAFLRPGDTLVVTRIDRLARNIKDLQDIVETLKQRGSTLTRTRRKALRSLASAAPATLTVEAYLGFLFHCA
jgi:DNA invertase Pin-like site-specific DNA recombinase